MDRRRFLALAALLASSGSVRAAVPAGFVDVRRHGARGDGASDDTPAFQRALDGAAGVWVPEGRYLVGDLALWSHTRLAGTGARSVLVHRPGSTFLAASGGGFAGSADPRDNVRDITIEDLAFEGRSVSDGFVQTNHLLVATGCSGLAVRRCAFRAFQGDGIYVAGSAYATGAERHNEDVTIRGCLFDGVNDQNRQGVSITDGTRVTVEGNLFRDCSRPDMPGALDIEPEAPWARIQDVRVLRNRFVNVLGGVGAICVILALDRYDRHPRGIEIRGNRVEGRFRTLGVVAKGFVDGAHAPPVDLVIAGNEILDTFHGFEISGLRGVRFEDNVIRGTTVAARLSVPHRGRAADVAVVRNRFEKVGMHSGVALKVHPTVDLTVADNRFVDCGWIDRRGGVAIDASEEPPAMMRAERNTFSEPRWPKGA
jgi:hypothetical protein